LGAGGVAFALDLAGEEIGGVFDSCCAGEVGDVELGEGVEVVLLVHLLDDFGLGSFFGVFEGVAGDGPGEGEGEGVDDDEDDGQGEESAEDEGHHGDGASVVCARCMGLGWFGPLVSVRMSMR